MKLSAEGFQFALVLPNPALTEVQQIADGVRQYAARLDQIYLAVAHISRVARVGTKIVQAVYVDVTDDIIPSEAPVDFRPRNGSSTHGKIVGQEPDGGVIYVSFDSEVFEASLPGFLSIDRGFLLYQLAERIRNLECLPNLIVPVLHNMSPLDIPVTG